MACHLFMFFPDFSTVLLFYFSSFRCVIGQTCKLWICDTCLIWMENIIINRRTKKKTELLNRRREKKEFYPVSNGSLKKITNTSVLFFVVCLQVFEWQKTEKNEKKVIGNGRNAKKKYTKRERERQNPFAYITENRFFFSFITAFLLVRFRCFFSFFSSFIYNDFFNFDYNFCRLWLISSAAFIRYA